MDLTLFQEKVNKLYDEVTELNQIINDDPTIKKNFHKADVFEVRFRKKRVFEEKDSFLKILPSNKFYILRILIRILQKYKLDSILPEEQIVQSYPHFVIIRQQKCADLKNFNQLALKLSKFNKEIHPDITFSKYFSPEEENICRIFFSQLGEEKYLILFDILKDFRIYDIGKDNVGLEKNKIKIFNLEPQTSMDEFFLLAFKYLEKGVNYEL